MPMEIKERRYEVVQAECPLCGKLLSGISEKNWMVGFKIHLRLAQKHLLPFEEIERLVKTVKPSFRRETKTKHHLK
jgi:hypothetical protein